VDNSRCPVEIVRGVPIVAAPKEVDITNAPSLKSAILEAARLGYGTVVVNMAVTRFCDSSGLYALLSAHKRAQADGGGLLVVATAAAVLRIFELTGVGSLIPHFSSLDDALALADQAKDPADLDEPEWRRDRLAHPG
jgi:anti-sigma B factor antagonist